MPLCEQFNIVYPSNPCDSFPTLYWTVSIVQQGSTAFLKVRASTGVSPNVPFMTFQVNWSQFAVTYNPGQPQTGTLIPDTGSRNHTIQAQPTTFYEMLIALNPNLNTLKSSATTYRIFYKGAITYPCGGRADFQINGIEFTP